MTQLDLATEVESIDRDSETDVYSELFFLLAGLDFDPEEAKSHWQGVLRHCCDLKQKIGMTVDPRAAVVSYLVKAQSEMGGSFLVEMFIGEGPNDFDSRDELTSPADSRLFAEFLQNELRRGQRYERPTSLLLLDPDDFEEYNDRNGRDSGDRALAKISLLLAKSLRGEDKKGRVGGKVFAVALPATTKTAAEQVAERVRKLVALQYFPGESRQPQGKLTACVGVATSPGDGRNASELIRQAERALSVAKVSGKNQVHLCGKDQRSHRRIEIALDGTLSTPATGECSLKTLDVSPAGVRFICSQHLAPESLFDLRLKIPNKNIWVGMAMRVLKSEMARQPCTAWISGRETAILGSYEVRARRIEIGAEDLRILKDHLREAVKGT